MSQSEAVEPDWSAWSTGQSLSGSAGSALLNGVSALQKTKGLFEHRFVLHAASHCLGGADYSAWLKDAVSTQLLIYRLDSCYEQSVEIDPAREQPLWRLLTERLRQAPCSSRDLLWANLRDLKAYALAEARIHSSGISVLGFQRLVVYT